MNPDGIHNPCNEQSLYPCEIARLYTERPSYKLSVKLIETYKNINKVIFFVLPIICRHLNQFIQLYYEERANRLQEQADVTRGGVHNDGYDDQHYDYIILTEEVINDIHT
jgi:hypothetical protein